MRFTSTNPTTGATIAVYRAMADAEVEAALDTAASAQRMWRETPFDEREVCLRRAGRILRDRVEWFASLMTAEMGKPISQSRAEIEKCALACDYYADHARAFLADEAVPLEGRSAFVTYRPLGVVFAIMPWNFPFWQVIRFAAPTLMAGNGALLKHAPTVFGCATAIEWLFAEAGFPAGLFTSLIVDHEQAERVIAHPTVRAVTLTGSTAAGRAVAAAAGRSLKKTVLELGGSDPYVVLEDADLEVAVEACATGRLINTGQSCIAAKRIIVVEPVRSEFRDRFVARMAVATFGDPVTDPPLGPMARVDLRDTVHDQVERTVAAGAQCLLGGVIPPGPGAFYPATVLDGVGPGMAAYEEEVFGPVASILPVADEGQALRTANDTSYGLGSAVFTQDLARGRRIAATGIEAGACFVNGYVASDPRLPFGGVRESGYGRELSEHGIREFVNIKTVVTNGPEAD